MNRRTFCSLAASALAAVGLSFAAVSLAEAGPGPIPGLCDDWRDLTTSRGRGFRARQYCVDHFCHLNWEAWGYQNSKVCRQVND